MSFGSTVMPPMETAEEYQHTQQTSDTSSRRSSGPKTPLSIDLSDVPSLITPSPPSNTLIITNLDVPAIFQPDNLQTIRSLIDQRAAIHTWSPLKSFRRIIVVFYDVDSARLIRQTLDGEVVFSCRMRVYFGANTDISPTDQHLRAPHLDKLFFISPPPSPPHGWEVRNEEPPNKEVHADDLALALARLHARHAPASPEEVGDAMDIDSGEAGSRKRSGSVIVYHPQHHGDSPNLPAISVEDTTDEPEEMSPVEQGAVRPIEHTMRPPVELMEQ